MAEKSINPHYLTALFIFFAKSTIFIAIIALCLYMINWVIGFDIMELMIDTIKMSIDNIMQLDSSLGYSLGIEFLEDRAFTIIVSIVLLTLVQHSEIVNRYWKFKEDQFIFAEGFLGLKKKSVPLDKIVRVYAVHKADYKNFGDLYIELTSRDKRLKLPFVYSIDDESKAISKKVERYKERVIEKEIEKDMASRQKP